MNVLLWMVQVVLALLYVAGGAYKAFMPDQLAGTMSALPRGGWQALGVVEMAGGLLLVVPAALKWMPGLTPLAAAALTLETVALVLFYASYSLEFAATNPLVWAMVMAVLVAFVAWGRYSGPGAA